MVGGEAQFTKREGKNETVPLTKRVADMIAALGNSGRYVASGNLILLLLAFYKRGTAGLTRISLKSRNEYRRILRLAKASRGLLRKRSAPPTSNCACR